MPTRPMSPHLSVYKFTYTMTLSILHRITGGALSFGFLLFAGWLLALATGPHAYQRIMNILQSGFGRLVLAGFVLAFVYHFCNGIRHLVWDAGLGLERTQARRSGIVVIVATLLLGGLVLWLGCRAFAAPGVTP